MKCPECGLDHDELKARWRSSLWLTATALCGFNSRNYRVPPSPRFHRALCDWVQAQIDGGRRRVLVMVPRGHLKTSLITIGVSVWQIIRDPDTRGFILHKLPDEAAGFLGAVKAILLSPTFRHYFPEIVPEDWGQTRKGVTYKWNEEAIEVKRSRYHPNATLEAKGLRSTYEGSHPVWAIADDLVDREISGSPSLMAKAVAFRRTIGQILEDPNRGFFLVVGTAWPGGFYEEVLDDPSYASLILGCYQDERSVALGLDRLGEPIWPERYTKEALEALRVEMGDFAFSHQYLNIFRSAGGVLAADDFKVYMYNASSQTFVVETADGQRELRLEDADEITAALDPATGAGEDDAAITVVASYMRDGGHLVLLDVWAARASPEAQLRKLFQLCRKWGVRRVGIEKIGWPMYQSIYHRMAAEEGVRLVPVLLSHGQRHKDERIAVLLPWIREGRLHIAKSHTAVVDQFLAYSPLRRDNKDDIIDSLAYHLLGLLNTRLRPRVTPLRRADDEDYDPEFEEPPRRQRIVPAYGLGRARW